MSRMAPGPAPVPARRQRASHSMEAVLSAAVSLLDEAGVPALTFRALAQRLGGGVGSIYWYVANKDELLDRAADHVLGDVLVATEDLADEGDPIGSVRAIAVALFDRIVERPWLGAYFLRNEDLQPNGLALYEQLGQQVLRLQLTDRQMFHAVSAVIGFVVGTAADMGQAPPAAGPAGAAGADAVRDGLTSDVAARWRELDPGRFPFLRRIVDEFEQHDDADQFRAGLDLLLAGLRLQAGID